MHDAGDDAQRHEDEEDVDIVAAQGLPDHVPEILGVRLPLWLIMVKLARAADQRSGLVERAIRGRGHGVRATRGG